MLSSNNTYNIKDSVHGFQPSVAVDAEGHVAARLDASIARAVGEVVVGQIFLLNAEHLPANVELDVWKRGFGRVGRVYIALYIFSIAQEHSLERVSRRTPWALENFAPGIAA